VLYPAADINLKSSWVLSYGFNFPAKSPMPVQGEVALDDGRRFRLIQTKARQVLFIDEQDHFCNKALNAASPPAAWAAGTLSLEGDDVALESRVVEEAVSEGGVRVIFNGVGGGQMGFQEVWINVSVRRTHLDDCVEAQIAVGGGVQRCGSKSSMRLAGWVGSRSRMSFR
jgi:hypothetical protein